VKLMPLLAIPPIDTTTFPVVAPAGTGTTMRVSDQVLVLAAVPLNVTKLVRVPTVVPKFVPVMFTTVPTGPAVGLILVMLGGGVTVKSTPLLDTPPTVTTTFPVVAPDGTGTVMLVALQLVGTPSVPLNATVLDPCVAPKFSPVIVIDAPMGPDALLRVEILGLVEVTVNATPLLATLLTVTTTLPVVAPLGTGTAMLVELQLVGAAATPLNVTVLVPWLPPKLLPVIVTEVPIAPEVGLRLVMLGGGNVTVKPTALLATPPTVTTTFPVVAPAGTGTAMLVALQFVGEAAVPLNVTVLVPCEAPKFDPLMVTQVPTTPDVGLKLVMLGTVMAPPVGLKAANAAAQMSEAPRVAVADALPAAV
jgi:hypothetical protein